MAKIENIENSDTTSTVTTDRGTRKFSTGRVQTDTPDRVDDYAPNTTRTAKFDVDVSQSNSSQRVVQGVSGERAGCCIRIIGQDIDGNWARCADNEMAGMSSVIVQDGTDAQEQGFSIQDLSPDKLLEMVGNMSASLANLVTPTFSAIESLEDIPKFFAELMAYFTGQQLADKLEQTKRAALLQAEMVKEHNKRVYKKLEEIHGKEVAAAKYAWVLTSTQMVSLSSDGKPINYNVDRQTLFENGLKNPNQLFAAQTRVC